MNYDSNGILNNETYDLLFGSSNKEKVPVKKKKKMKPSNATNNLQTNQIKSNNNLIRPNNIVAPKTRAPPDINKIKESLEQFKAKKNNEDIITKSNNNNINKQKENKETHNRINKDRQFINKKRNYSENKVENRDRNENYKIKKIN